MIRICFLVTLATVFSITVGKVLPIPIECIKPQVPHNFDCCKRFNRGCLPAGSVCSVGGLSAYPPTPCAHGTACVIDDFGFIIADLPSQGKCTMLKEKVPKCSVEFCTSVGGGGICKVSGLIAKCRAWATRKDFGPKPKCPKICPEICSIPQLKASNGKQFCSLCVLRSASCSSNFSFYGPVKN